MATFNEYLAKTGLPEAALAPITDNVREYLDMVNKSNGLVAQINAAKSNDPNNTEFLDARWRANESDERIAEKVAQFDAIAEEYEKLLAELRGAAKEHFLVEALSEDDARKAKGDVNSMAPTISKTRDGIAQQLTLVESMLKLSGVEIPEGGLVTLLPVAESLKNVRGRKAATDAGIKVNKTRVGEILVDGKSTNRDGRGKLDYAADVLSQRFNVQSVPANKVTPEELEEAMFAALEVEFRSLKSTELPLEKTFTFEKTIKVQNKNDDGFTEIPEKVQITVRSVNYGKEENKSEESKTETPKTESAPAAKAPAKKAEPAKK